MKKRLNWKKRAKLIGNFRRRKLPSNDEEEVGDKVKVDSPGRGHWAQPREFTLSCLGSAVGLGTVWRYPYVCYSNGGGIFIIPYTLMLLLVGVPLLLMELAVGQYSAAGPLHVFNSAPLLQGIGAGMVNTLWGSVYYQVIIAWALYYLSSSWHSTLPWSHCRHHFNTPYCYSKEEAKGCESINGLWFNQTCFNATELGWLGNSTVSWNSSHIDSGLSLNTTNSSYSELLDETRKRVSPAEEYFNYGMLDRSDDIESTGSLKWDISLTYLVSWLLLYFCILKGVKSTGKVVYFTATLPYLLLTFLLFRAVTLPGAWAGIHYYLNPNFTILQEPKVWAAAAGQVFFSLGVGGGGLISYASYNKFNQNFYRDTWIIIIANGLTSFLSGFIIFAILGYVSQDMTVNVQKVVQSGSSLAFIAYPEMVSGLPFPQLWSILFFLTILTLGLNNMFSCMENIMTTLVDTFTSLRPYRPFACLGVCILFFFFGLTKCTNSGIYWMELFAYFCGGWAMLFMGGCECIAFSWVYGARRLHGDVETMLGFKLWPIWRICWAYVSPGILVVIIIMNVIDYTPPTYGEYTLPDWAQKMGWTLAANGVSMVPAVAVVNVLKSYKDSEFEGLSIVERIKKLAEPNSKWEENMTENTRTELLEDIEEAVGDLTGSPDENDEDDGDGEESKDTEEDSEEGSDLDEEGQDCPLSIDFIKDFDGQELDGVSVSSSYLI